MKRTGFKIKKVKPNTKDWYYKQSDKMLTPIIKKLYPKCLLCENETQVAHHFIYKAKSNRLRYEVSNLINFCNNHHFLLHHSNQAFWSAKIVQKKGIEWFNELEVMKNEYVHTDLYFYKSNYERLSKVLDNGMI